MLIFFLLTSIAFIHAHECLLKLEHASFTIADLQGTIPQHLATINSNPSLISTYAARMDLYRIDEISTFTKLLVSAPQYHLHLSKVPLIKIKKSWIAAASAGHYQVIEHSIQSSLPPKIYVFLGYAEGKDPRADSLVSSFKERLEKLNQ